MSINLRPTGAVIPNGISKTEWRATGARFGSMASGLRWSVGDWLAFGLKKGWVDGTKYAEAQEVTGLSFDSLSQSLRVALCFAFDERLVRLSWSHHRAVLALGPAGRHDLLARAVKERLTVQQTSDIATNVSANSISEDDEEQMDVVATTPTPAKRSHWGQHSPQRPPGGWQTTHRSREIKNTPTVRTALCPKCGTQVRVML